MEGKQRKYFHSGLVYDHRGVMEANLGGIAAIETLRCSLVFCRVFKSVRLNKAFTGKYLKLIFNRSSQPDGKVLISCTSSQTMSCQSPLFMLPVVARSFPGNSQVDNVVRLSDR